MLMVSEVMLAAARGLNLLVFRDSQRAEYLADLNRHAQVFFDQTDIFVAGSEERFDTTANANALFHRIANEE